MTADVAIEEWSLRTDDHHVVTIRLTPPDPGKVTARGKVIHAPRPATVKIMSGLGISSAELAEPGEVRDIAAALIEAADWLENQEP